MAKKSFRNIAAELVEFADSVLTHFETHGYTCSIEKVELGFPYTPTIICRRNKTKIVVEIYTKVLHDRVDNWVAFGKSSGEDFRLAVCLPPKSKLSNKDSNRLRNSGVGLYVGSEQGLDEILVPSDLALNIQLPKLANFSIPVRKMLGPAYEQFGRGHWREGFEDACQAFENGARAYFKKGSRAGRITVMRKNGPVTLASNVIDKMTMGQLAKEFGKIVSRTHSDQIIEKTLTQINKDRVGVVHHKGKAATENRLRKNVGKHMWTIANAMKELV